MHTCEACNGKTNAVQYQYHHLPPSPTRFTSFTYLPPTPYSPPIPHSLTSHPSLTHPTPTPYTPASHLPLTHPPPTSHPSLTHLPLLTHSPPPPSLTHPDPHPHSPTSPPLTHSSLFALLRSPFRASKPCSNVSTSSALSRVMPSCPSNQFTSSFTHKICKRIHYLNHGVHVVITKHMGIPLV